MDHNCQCWLHALCFMFWCQVLWHPSGAQFSEQQVLRDNSVQREWEICEWRFSIMRSRTSSKTSSVIMDDLPLRSSSSTGCRPAVNCLHQGRTICLLMTLDPYTWHRWRWISIGTIIYFVHSKNLSVGGSWNKSIFKRCKYAIVRNREVLLSACVMRRHYSIRYKQSFHAINGLLAVGRVANILCGCPS